MPAFLTIQSWCRVGVSPTLWLPGVLLRHLQFHVVSDAHRGDTPLCPNDEGLWPGCRRQECSCNPNSRVALMALPRIARSLPDHWPHAQCQAYRRALATMLQLESPPISVNCTPTGKLGVLSASHCTFLPGMCLPLHHCLGRKGTGQPRYFYLALQNST